jgi:hypothetical protein
MSIRPNAIAYVERQKYRFHCKDNPSPICPPILVPFPVLPFGPDNAVEYITTNFGKRKREHCMPDGSDADAEEEEGGEINGALLQDCKAESNEKEFEMNEIDQKENDKIEPNGEVKK